MSTTRIVLDASVVLKWLLPTEKEAHVAQALALLQQVKSGEVVLIQPPHWLVEVGAVLARLTPNNAELAMKILYAMELPIQSSDETYSKGMQVAAELNHHLFDTLYHAIALNGDADMLVTDDRTYFRKAKSLGSIMLLADWK